MAMMSTTVPIANINNHNIKFDYDNYSDNNEVANDNSYYNNYSDNYINNKDNDTGNTYDTYDTDDTDDTNDASAVTTFLSIAERQKVLLSRWHQK